VDRIDTVGNPTDLRLRATGSYQHFAWTFSAAANYVDDYRESAEADSPRIGSWLTIDAGLTYRHPDGSGPLQGTEISARVVNLFNAAPPFVDNIQGRDTFYFNTLGRVF